MLQLAQASSARPWAAWALATWARLSAPARRNPSLPRTAAALPSREGAGGGDGEQGFGRGVDVAADQVPGAGRECDTLFGPAEIERLVRQDAAAPGGVAARIGLLRELEASGVVLLGQAFGADVVRLPAGEVGELGGGAEHGAPVGVVAEPAGTVRGDVGDQVLHDGGAAVAAAEGFVRAVEGLGDGAHDVDFGVTDVPAALTGSAAAVVDLGQPCGAQGQQRGGEHDAATVDATVQVSSS